VPFSTRPWSNSLAGLEYPFQGPIFDVEAYRLPSRLPMYSTPSTIAGAAYENEPGESAGRMLHPLWLRWILEHRRELPQLFALRLARHRHGSHNWSGRRHRRQPPESDLIRSRVMNFQRLAVEIKRVRASGCRAEKYQFPVRLDARKFRTGCLKFQRVRPLRSTASKTPDSDPKTSAFHHERGGIERRARPKTMSFQNPMSPVESW